MEKTSKTPELCLVGNSARVSSEIHAGVLQRRAVDTPLLPSLPGGRAQRPPDAPAENHARLKGARTRPSV